ncbi:NYN domain-containing protein [Dechloromonas denitrificans]|uniref:NYN domain-containing protein n=1 Tax=Dechloromonas denitrificans TaxID=281362 RepID=UPI001CF9BDC5|nr:NYN domain-containing protein [Dechloromonas denitrificans]
MDGISRHRNIWIFFSWCHPLSVCGRISGFPTWANCRYRYAAGKNTADIALALEAMFDHRAKKFCLVTSDSDFVYLCRKLRERGATLCVVGKSKTPDAQRNASDRLYDWVPADKAEPVEPRVFICVRSDSHR